MTRIKVVIPFTLPGLNEYINAERRNRFMAATMKKKVQSQIIAAAKKQLRSVKFNGPVHLAYSWYEKDRRRDYDNVCFAQKFVQDALVTGGWMQNDSQKCFVAEEPFSHKFYVDKKNPRVEVEITEPDG